MTTQGLSRLVNPCEGCADKGKLDGYGDVTFSRCDFCHKEAQYQAKLQRDKEWIEEMDNWFTEANTYYHSFLQPTLYITVKDWEAIKKSHGEPKVNEYGVDEDYEAMIADIGGEL